MIICIIWMNIWFQIIKIKYTLFMIIGDYMIIFCLFFGWFFDDFLIIIQCNYLNHIWWLFDLIKWLFDSYLIIICDYLTSHDFFAWINDYFNHIWCLFNSAYFKLFDGIQSFFNDDLNHIWCLLNYTWCLFDVYLIILMFIWCLFDVCLMFI